MSIPSQTVITSDTLLRQVAGTLAIICSSAREKAVRVLAEAQKSDAVLFESLGHVEISKLKSRQQIWTIIQKESAGKMVSYHCEACDFTTAQKDRWKKHNLSPNHAIRLQRARIDALPQLAAPLIPERYRPMEGGLLRDKLVNPLQKRGFVPKTNTAASKFMEQQLMKIAAPIYAETYQKMVEERVTGPVSMPESIKRKMTRQNRDDDAMMRKALEAAEQADRIKKIQKQAAEQAYRAAKAQMDRIHAEQNELKLRRLLEQRARQKRQEEEQKRNEFIRDYYKTVIHPSLVPYAQKQRSLPLNALKRGLRTHSRIWWNKHVIFSSRFKGTCNGTPLRMAAQSLSEQVLLTDAQVLSYYQQGYELGWHKHLEQDSPNQSSDQELDPWIMERMAQREQPKRPYPFLKERKIKATIGVPDEDSGYQSSQYGQSRELAHIRQIQNELSEDEKKKSKLPKRTRAIIKHRRAKKPSPVQRQQDLLLAFRDKIFGFAKMADPALKVAYLKFEFKMMPEISEFMPGTAPIARAKQIYRRWNQLGGKTKKLAAVFDQ